MIVTGEFALATPRFTRPTPITPTYEVKSNDEICIWNGPSRSASGGLTLSTIVWNKGSMVSPCEAKSKVAQPWNAEAYTTGKSNCSSVAPKLSNRSNT